MRSLEVCAFALHGSGHRMLFTEVAVDNEEFVSLEISAYDCRTGFSTTWIDSTCPNCTLRACMDPEFLDDWF